MSHLKKKELIKKLYGIEILENIKAVRKLRENLTSYVTHAKSYLSSVLYSEIKSRSSVTGEAA